MDRLQFGFSSLAADPQYCFFESEGCGALTEQATLFLGPRQRGKVQAAQLVMTFSWRAQFRIWFADRAKVRIGPNEQFGPAWPAPGLHQQIAAARNVAARIV